VFETVAWYLLGLPAKSFGIPARGSLDDVPDDHKSFR
jgi:hypothetical protein